jgi:hypothetical protein
MQVYNGARKREAVSNPLFAHLVEIQIESPPEEALLLSPN